jgi:hypothetical protein
MTDAEEVPGGAQGLAFQIAALECRQIEWAQGSARIKHARDAPSLCSGHGGFPSGFCRYGRG